MTLSGGCECGSIRYRLSDVPLTVNCCRCRDCQRITGSVFAINAMIESDRVIVTQGVPEERSLDREGRGDAHAWRCATCETLLWADHPMFGDAVRFVRAGTLDRAELLAPDAHYFVRSRHPWVTLPAGVPQFETLPADGTGVVLEGERATRMATVMARVRG